MRVSLSGKSDSQHPACTRLRTAAPLTIMEHCSLISRRLPWMPRAVSECGGDARASGVARGEAALASMGDRHWLDHGPIHQFHLSAAIVRIKVVGPSVGSRITNDSISLVATTHRFSQSENTGRQPSSRRESIKLCASSRPCADRSGRAGLSSPAAPGRCRTTLQRVGLHLRRQRCGRPSQQERKWAACDPNIGSPVCPDSSTNTS